MPASVLPPLTNSVPGKVALNPGWKLNQVLLATVANAASGGKILRINGNSYTPLNPLHVEAGKTLQLQVKSLSPFIELALVHTAKALQRPENLPGIILSDRILQRAGQNFPANTTGLLRVINLLNALSMQSPPPAAAAVIAALYERITTPDRLVHAGTLKGVILNASLLLAGKLEVSDVLESDKNLKALLFQLVRSIGGEEAGTTGKMTENYGLSLYRNVGNAGAGLALLLMRELEDELLRLFYPHRRTNEVLDEYAPRWIIELPVNFQSRIRSVSIKIFEQEHAKNSGGDVPGWIIEFILELPCCGDMKIELSIKDLAVGVTVTSTSSTTARLLTENQGLLRDKFAGDGLQFRYLRCNTTSKTEFDTYLSHNAPLQFHGETLPLESIEIREQGQERGNDNSIPDLLYDAMADLFSFILAVEHSLSETQSAHS